MTKIDMPSTSQFAAFEAAMLDAIPLPILRLNEAGVIGYGNIAAQEFFGMGQAQLQKTPLATLLPFASPITALLARCFAENASLSEHDIALDTPHSGRERIVDVHITPCESIDDGGKQALLVVQARSIAQHIEQLLAHRGASRAVQAMSGMLAHEIKNPLSGIRGAAQLLAAQLDDAFMLPNELTTLICNETDRITALVDQFEQFGVAPPHLDEAVNVHEVLGQVRLLAESGFASHITFSEDYDPSLPHVLGDKGALTQVFLNLIKNAAEAAEMREGESRKSGKSKICLRSAYRGGARLFVPDHYGTQRRGAVSLPLEFSVIDNGVGIPENIRAHLFDPFVSTKAQGKGLGLALVAKIIDEHGGTIQCESTPTQTSFHVRLPLMQKPTRQEKS